MNVNLSGAGPIGRSIIERDISSLSPSYAREYALVVDHAQGSVGKAESGRGHVLDLDAFVGQCCRVRRDLYHGTH